MGWTLASCEKLTELSEIQGLQVNLYVFIINPFIDINLEPDVKKPIRRQTKNLTQKM